MNIEHRELNMDRIPRPRVSSIAGFTLIEVMVALTITALVVGMSYTGLTVGLDSWERGSRAIDDLESSALVERLLKRQLSVASPREFETAEQKFTLFRGSTNRIEFIADYSLLDGFSDFRKIDYFTEGGVFLYGESYMYDYVPSRSEPAPTQTLAEFEDISFRYLKQDENDVFEWVDDWQAGMTLPAAVQVQIDDDTFVIRLVNR